MKILSQATLLSVALLALGACKSTGTDKASSTVTDLKKLQAELEKGQASIESAVTAMNALSEEGGDMAAEYKAYCDAVDDVESQRDRVRSIRQRLTERREAFLTSWEEGLEGIQNASMKERAMERHQAIAAQFDKLNETGDDTRAEFDKWFSDLTDARTYLEHDLNPSGVASLKNDFSSLTKRAGKINKVVGEFTTKLGDLIEHLEAAKPPEPEKS